MYRHFERDARLLPLSASSLRRRWLALMAALRVPDVAELRPTPGSLRGSGATFFYMCTEDISRLQWRGRWRSCYVGVLFAGGCSAELLK
eukprot:4034681-Amphidinium_carterae.1